MPDTVGFTVDPKERASIASVRPGTPAEKAGLKAGDRIVRMAGQPILSTADLQWVLHDAPDGGPVKLEVRRADVSMESRLDLAEGWRRDGDFTWRTIVWSLRHRLLGVEPLEVPGAEERTALGIAEGEMALRIRGFPPDWVKDRNPSAKAFQKGDVIVAIGGRKDLGTESKLLSFLVQQRAGDVELILLRAGARVPVTLKLP